MRLNQGISEGRNDERSSLWDEAVAVGVMDLGRREQLLVLIGHFITGKGEDLRFQRLCRRHGCRETK